MAQTLRKGLTTIPTITILTPEDPTMSNGMITFKSSAVSYSQIVNTLGSKYKMRARIVTEDNLNAVRISTHIFNLAKDVFDLLVAIREIVTSKDFEQAV